MDAAIVSALAAAGSGSLLGLGVALVARPRGGPPLLVDAVVEVLRSPIALLALPVPALLVGDAGAWPALVGVAAFITVFLPAFEARRRDRR